MKPTLLWLTAAAATACALVFWIYAQQPQRANVETAAETKNDNSTATPAPVEVSNLSNDVITEATEEVAVVEEEARPAFVGDAFETGVERYQAGDFAAAAEALEWAVRDREDQPYRHYLLGLCYRKIGLPEGAVEEFERTLELAPGQLRAYVNIARANLDLDRLEEARMAVDVALEIDIDDADAWNVLGLVELGSQDLEAAAAAFGKSTERRDDHAYAWNNLGYVRIQQGRFVDGLAPLERAVATGVEEAYFFNNLGIVYEQLERLNEASIAFGRAASLGHAAAEESLARIEPLVPESDELLAENEEEATVAITH